MSLDVAILGFIKRKWAEGLPPRSMDSVVFGNAPESLLVHVHDRRIAKRQQLVFMHDFTVTPVSSHHLIDLAHRDVQPDASALGAGFGGHHITG